MFELAYFVVSAEREWRDTAMKTYEEKHLETQVWLWQHKVLFFMLGVLLVAGLLAAGGNGL